MTTSAALNEDQEEDENVSNLAESLEGAEPPSNAYLVRQPILDREMKVQAFDLLYGERGEVRLPKSGASSQVMLNAFLDIGLETISAGRLSIIQITSDFIEDRLPLPFPSADVVLEIPGDAFETGVSTEALEKLSSRGFRLAYRPIDPGAISDEQLASIDFLKLDLESIPKARLEETVPQLIERGLSVLAVNVDTQEALGYCQQLGIEFYQGRFISEPALVKGNTLKPSRIALLNILKILEDPDCDISALEDLIVQDITLSYKILRIINSAFYGFRRKIDSVKQAVVSLGLKVIRDWFIIISLTDIDDKPEILMFQTLQRARMMQLLTETIGLNKDTGFTIGLFSSIDSIMDQPMDVILKALPLSGEITEALLERTGTLGELLDLVIRYESGDWDYIDSVGFEPSELSTYYFESMCWARGLFDQIKSE